MAGDGVIFVTNAAQLAARWEMRAEALDAELQAAEREMLAQARALAIENSSGRAYAGGGIVTARGKRIYPYSVRTPAPPIPPQIANIQSGRLLRGWRTQYEANSDGSVSTLYNVAPEARFFNGVPTRKMIARPLLQDVNLRLRGPRLAALAEAKSAALAIGADEVSGDAGELAAAGAGVPGVGMLALAGALGLGLVGAGVLGGSR